MEGKCRPEALPQVDPIECAHKFMLLPKTPLEGMPTALEASGTCQPKDKLPWEATPESRRPFKAKRANVSKHL
jgi:hypothetical protein